MVLERQLYYSVMPFNYLQTPTNISRSLRLTTLLMISIDTLRAILVMLRTHL